MAYLYTVTRSILNDQFTVKFAVSSITDADVQKFSKFGAPIVDFGGSFTGPPVFTLSTDQRSLQTMNVSKVFDKNADPDAETKAQAYDSEVRVRISDALTTLRANTDTFTTSEEVEV